MAIVKISIFQQTQRYLPYLICLLVFILGGCGSTSTPSSSGYAEINSPFPIISQGRVYVNTGLLQFVDQKTGAKVGSYQIGKPNLSFQFDPITANGSIYIIGDPTISAPKSSTGNQKAVYALQEKSGAILWQSVVDATAIVGIAGDLVYVYAHDSTLMALQISDGKVRWKYSTGNATTDFTSFDVLQGVVYVGSSDASLSALDATTGAVLWHHTLGDTGLTASALANGVLYACDRREMFAVQPGNGAVLWRVTLTNDLRAGEVTSLIISNSVAYTTVGDSTSETVVALNTRDGHILWRHPFPGQRLTDSHLLAVTDNIVLYADLYRPLSSTNNTSEQRASIIALRGKDGSVLWQDQIAGFADPSISADDGSVYAVEQADSSGGLIDIVYAFQISTGTRLWHTDIPLN